MHFYSFLIFFLAQIISILLLKHCKINGRNALIIKSLEFNVPFSLRDTDQNRCCVNGGVTETQKFATKPKLKTSAFQCF